VEKREIDFYKQEIKYLGRLPGGTGSSPGSSGRYSLLCGKKPPGASNTADLIPFGLRLPSPLAQETPG
jgi:hypothetical protein